MMHTLGMSLWNVVQEHCVVSIYMEFNFYTLVIIGKLKYNLISIKEIFALKPCDLVSSGYPHLQDNVFNFDRIIYFAFVVVVQQWQVFVQTVLLF